MDILEWEDYPYEYKHKTQDWYWALGIIALSGALASILFGNILLGILIIIGGFTLGVHAAHRPTVIHFELTPEGIISDKILYPYESLESFWVEEDHNDTRILFKSKKMLMPYIIVPLGGVLPETARAYLARYIKEVEHHEPIFQKMLEYLGF